MEDAILKDENIELQELKKLFEESYETEETFAVIRNAIMKGLIEVDNFMIYSIEFSIMKNAIVYRYIGLALRGGANPNYYVPTTVDIDEYNIDARVHILRYIEDITPKSFQESVLLDSNYADEILEERYQSRLEISMNITKILLSAGSNPEDPITKDEFIENPGRYRLRAPALFQSVYLSSDDKDLYGQNFDNKEISLLSLDTGRTELKDMFYFYDQQSLKEFYEDKYKNYEILADNQISYLNENIAFDLILLHYNKEIYEYMLDRGFMPSRSMFQDILLKAKKYCGIRPLICEILHDMIILSVIKGYPVDSDETRMIGTFSPKTKDKIMMLSKKPKWKKECANNDPNPSSYLQQVGLLLNIPIGASKREICSTIEEYENLEDVKISENSQALQEGKLILNSQSFKTREVEYPFCENASSLKHEVGQYPDVHIVSYSNNGVSWCISSDFYEDVISTELNPWTKEKIPRQVLEQIKYKYNLLRNFSEDDITIPDGIRLLRKEGDLSDNNTVTSQKVEKFKRWLQKYNIEAVQSLRPDEFTELANYSLPSEIRYTADPNSQENSFANFADSVLTTVKYYDEEQIAQNISQFLES